MINSELNIACRGLISCAQLVVDGDSCLVEDDADLTSLYLLSSTQEPLDMVDSAEWRTEPFGEYDRALLASCGISV